MGDCSERRKVLPFSKTKERERRLSVVESSSDERRRRRVGRILTISSYTYGWWRSFRLKKAEGRLFFPAEISY